ncbi:FAD-binding and (Fe-S)-binding domain-containing protein [Microlunatus sp. GCM10028923]|uniref:FAD-binding and (Fe-S)-binding domain-containing protein n=1 Tax=Microlunatus sp. GCM10028923 TaxID=3273400 RepID=UPI0036124519
MPVDPALLAELEALVPGGVKARATDRLAYAHDASHYLLTPEAVVVPRDAGQLAALLRASAVTGRALTFRSGGTSLSGQASTDAVLVDTRRNFRRIDVLDDGLRVRVQPGATVRQVNTRLARYGRKLGPDPASESACTIGGVVANNSSGMSCGITANTYRTLESAVLILPSGTVLDTAAPDADERLRLTEPELYLGLDKLRDRVRDNPTSVKIITEQYSIKNTMGYGLNSFLDHDRPVDLLLHLVIGSEGTLAFVAEATFRTVPAHPAVGTGLLIFDRLADATRALPVLVDTEPVSIELLDATSLRVAQRDPQATADLLGLAVQDHTALLIEYAEPDADALRARTELGLATMAELPLAAAAELSADPSRRGDLWHIRKGLYATIAGNRAPGTTALLEDIAVPVPSLLATCEELTGLFQRYDYHDSVIFGHARDGNLHFMLSERLGDRDQLRRYADFTEDLVDLVLAQHGTLKAEHGTGRIMAPYVRRQFGDELYQVMIEIKQLCDPKSILNPGILINEDPHAHLAHLKTAPEVEPEVDRCVECGYCEPVCPSRDLTLTPRQRIVLRRELARAEQEGDHELAAELRAEYDYDGLDTCAADGMCGTACPVLIDTGQLVKRLRAEQAPAAGRTGWGAAARGWDAGSRVGSLALSVAERAPAAAVTRVNQLGRALLGTDTVPLWQPDLPGGGRVRRPHPTRQPEAIYLPACIQTLFGPERDFAGEKGIGVSEALLNLCGRAEVEIVVPDGIAGVCCGTPWKSKGFLSGWAAMRDRVRPIVSGASGTARLPVISDGASCSEGFRTLLEGTDAVIMDAVDFVAERVLPRLTINRRLGALALHPTCSSTQNGGNPAMIAIGRAIAEEVVVPDAWACCGFAGDRGLLHPELTAAATRAEAAEIGGRHFDAYASVNRTCELGLTRATGRPYRHLLELLDEATRP